MTDSTRMSVPFYNKTGVASETMSEQKKNEIKIRIILRGKIEFGIKYIQRHK